MIVPKSFRMECNQAGWGGSYTAGSPSQLGAGQEQTEKTWDLQRQGWIIVDTECSLFVAEQEQTKMV